MAKKQTPSAPRRKYDEAFKNEALRLVTTGNRSVPDVARSLGISDNLLYNWKSKLKITPPQNGAYEQELHQLREQLRKTEQERDILKSLYSADAVEWLLQLIFSAQNPTFNRFLNQASRFYWYLIESFLKSGLERTMLLEKHLVNKLVIASANPVQKTLTLPLRSQKSLTINVLWKAIKHRLTSFMLMLLASM
ncbi:transposase [Spirosoma sp. KCTC 42546]|uniref:transposase n=1 Tax=Spirosoma sp. KCTC 42546 TaxID=2520506 RepID=UPI00115A7570|nr:transposase [Spirosoma sp. KCTC 42546]QDK82631.1 transposase [Spirosoma sp. KCTC 42546]